MWRKTGLMGCILGLALVAGTARGDLIIDTYTGWDGNDAFNPFGSLSGIEAIEIVGQTFTVGTEFTVLENFKFWVEGFSNAIAFNAYVYQWDNNKVTGNELYASGLQTTATGTSWEAFSFSPSGGLELVANQVYVAFLQASSGVGGYVAARPDNQYSGGRTYYLNDSTNLTSTWSTFNAGVAEDFVFQASFGEKDLPVVPEPSSLAVFGLSCACMAMLRLRRSRSHAPTS